MKARTLKTTLLVIAVIASVAGCGGGGDDDAGSPTAFSVVPDTLTLNAPLAANGGPPAGVCVAGAAGEVFVYGGAAPYRLDNTAPDVVMLNKSEVSNRGGSFTVTYRDLGGGQSACLDTVIIVVVDKLDRQVTVKLNNKSAS